MDDRSLPPSIDRESLSQLEFDFYTQYGRTLAAWARIEQTLGRLFCKLSGFGADDKKGPAIFYSGRSFQTRADLIAAAIRTSDLPDDVKDYLRAIKNKARDYSKARNAIAHGFPAHIVLPDVDWQGWRIKEGELSGEAGGIGVGELRAAQWHFMWFEVSAQRAVNLVDHHIAGIAWSPAEHLEQVRELPKDPFLPSQSLIEEEARQSAKLKG